VVDGVDAADIVAADAAGVVDVEDVGEQRQSLPARELAEVDHQHAVQLALVDGADAGAAMHVGEDIIGVFQPVDDAAIAKPFAEACRIAVLRQTGCDRRLRNAVLGFRPPRLGMRTRARKRDDEHRRQGELETEIETTTNHLA
jgi:hypothetical protein